MPTLSPEKTFEFKEKMAALQASLLEAHPQMPVLLREIHTLLKKDPEVVTLLEEEEIGVLVNCLKVQTKTEIATTTKKETAATAIKKAVRAAKASGGSLVDLL